MSQASPALAETIEPADITHSLERLHAGDVFVELRHDSVASRAAGLDALLGHFADTETKLLWIGNPLRSPLTIERVFLQAAGPEADLRIDRSPYELAAILRSAAGGTTRCLLILHQPETLDADARETLAAIAPLLADAIPTIQFLFCATSAFRPITPSPAATAADPITLERPLSALPSLVYTSIPEPGAATGRLSRILLLVLAILGVLLTASVTDPPAPLSSPVAFAPIGTASAETSPTPAPGQPSPSETQVRGSAATPASTPRTDVTALRREFDVFLTRQSPHLATLTPEERDALFEEFVQRQNRRDRAAP